MGADQDEIFAMATANRLLAADLFDTLTPAQWRTPSLCAGWTVQDVAAHLTMPFQVSVGPQALLELALRHRGSFDAWGDATTRRLGQQPPARIVATLRERARDPLTVPFVGALGPLSDTAIHLRDAARPLGSDVSPPLGCWRVVLDFLVSPRGSRGFVRRGRLKDLRLVATDQDWSWGSGSEARGPSEALALAVTGRPVALADLEGPGVAVLASRLG